jgi:hypothetical protein
MTERFIALDAWARDRPRARDKTLLVVGTVACAVAVFAAFGTATESPPPPAVAAMSAAQMQTVESQTRELNELMDHMAEPWLLWLRDALVDLPPRTTLLQIDLDRQTRRVRLTLELEDFNAIDAVIARLERHGRFARLRASGHERDAAGRVHVLVDGLVSQAVAEEIPSP